jgi:hypothetical protein
MNALFCYDQCMDNSQIKFPDLAKELITLLEEDQNEWREHAYREYATRDKSKLRLKKQRLRNRVHERAEHMLSVLKTIGEPSVTNIGTEGALAVSVLAMHSSLETTRQVLRLFNELYARDKSNTRYASIPAMTDWIAILEHEQQRFGTIWLMDKRDEPFLPTVKDFEHVNERRAEYGIEPLRWPKLLAIPEEKQPWLARPIDELVMRDPTDEEYREFEQDYIS